MTLFWLGSGFEPGWHLKVMNKNLKKTRDCKDYFQNCYKKFFKNSRLKSRIFRAGIPVDYCSKVNNFFSQHEQSSSSKIWNDELCNILWVITNLNNTINILLWSSSNTNHLQHSSPHYFITLCNLTRYSTRFHIK